MTTDNLNTESDVEIDTLQDEVATLRARLATVERERDDARARAAKLQAFKDYVHKRLDEMGVPADPESPHKAAGCRIGGRLDALRAQLERARGALGTLVGHVEIAAVAYESMGKALVFRLKGPELTAARAALAEPAPAPQAASLPRPSTVEGNDKLPTNSAAPTSDPGEAFRYAPMKTVTKEELEAMFPETRRHHSQCTCAFGEPGCTATPPPPAKPAEPEGPRYTLEEVDCAALSADKSRPGPSTMTTPEWRAAFRRALTGKGSGNE